MKNRVGILIKTSICILLIMSLCGCWNRRELDTLGIVMGIGVDKPTKSGKVQITAQIVKPAEMKSQGNDSGGGSTEAFWNVSSTGKTVFSTLRDITSKSSRKLFFPHNQIIIFDNSIAKDGIQKYIDFFMRDPETRANVLVLVSEGSAADVLNVKSELEKIPANNISKLINIYADSTSETRAIKINEVIPALMSRTTSLTLPFIKISKNNGEKTAMISDTAVFKRDKLVGRMNKTEGRGLMWVLGKVKSTIINVKDSSNNNVSLETIRANSKIMPEINNKKITIKVKIFEEGNIGEQDGPKNLSKLKEVAFLERNKAKVIKNEVMSAVKKAKKLNADVFGFGDAVHRKYPKQWKKLESKWNKKFKDVQVKVAIETKLRLMGRILVPSVPVPEKEKK